MSKLEVPSSEITISVRVPRVVRDAADRVAREDGRSLSKLVGRLLVAHLKERGALSDLE